MGVLTIIGRAGGGLDEPVRGAKSQIRCRVLLCTVHRYFSSFSEQPGTHGGRGGIDYPL